MRLSDLNRFDNIVIQMHDNPDADAVGSGFAIYRYFEALGKKVRLVYGGSFKIAKSNMLLLINELKIPVEYVTGIEPAQLLITVDCQYGEGNVTHLEAENVAMIDHHNTGKMSDDMAEIRSNLVSCATICYDMLKSEGFDVNEDIRVSTALYYGLYMDSNELSEMRHPLEWDMAENLKIDRALIKRFTHANFTLQEMETAGIAMIRHSYDAKKRLSIIRSKPCDPNILGLVGDFVLQVDSIDVCIIFNECPNGYKLSIRSCVPDVAANEMAEFLTEDIGNGGGHLDKAGGFINGMRFEEEYGGLGIETYFFKRADEYYNSYDVIYAKDGIKDKSGFRLYKKLPYTYGYVRTTDVFEAGTEFRVRTYEGDVFVTSSEDIYLMIGYYGEVYPIEKSTFITKYQAKEDAFVKHFEYAPSIRNLKDNHVYGLMPFAKQCVSVDEAKVYAKHLEKPTKVFSKWNYEKYMYGNSNYYICFTYGDDKDIYLVRKEVFEKTYAEEN
ncbi:MAG: DHH family phosphoesterase [Clostridia bacterium]|nr:DHH family phosphoesterase [Clostridia bacterium]